MPKIMSETVSAALCRAVLAATAAIVAAMPVLADDLPSFPGDGRDTSRPLLGRMFTPVRSLPEEQGRDGDAVRDWASLQEVLATQARVAARVKPDQSFSIDGVDRPVTGRDLSRMVELLDQWHGAGRPLDQIADAYLLKGDGQGNVRFTGYFTPSIAVTGAPSARFRFPLYRKPAGRPEPLPTRREIDGGALKGAALELAWTDSLVDLYFLQVQGSGYGTYPDGRRVLFSYGGKNGHPYVSIGKHLVEQGEIAAESISMAAIKDWFGAHPDRVGEVMELNPSYSFFATDKEAVTGAAGVPVTPFRSVAADGAVLPLGSMVLIEVPILDAEGRVSSYQPRVMAVQDRGGAIKGHGRIDIYMGAGPEAEALAGRLKHFGRVWLLLPRGE